MQNWMFCRDCTITQDSWRACLEWMGHER